MLDAILLLVLGPLIVGALAYGMSFLIIKFSKRIEETPSTIELEGIWKVNITYKTKMLIYIWLIGCIIYYGIGSIA